MTTKSKGEQMAKKSDSEQMIEIITALMTEHAKGRADLQLVMDSCLAARLTLEQPNGCEGCAFAASFIRAVQTVLRSTSEGLRILSEGIHEDSVAQKTLSMISSKASAVATTLRGPHITAPGKGEEGGRGIRDGEGAGKGHQHRIRYVVERVPRCSLG